MKRLEGKIAIVTGAEGTLGAACVERLAGEGARVVAAGSVEHAAGVVPHDGASPKSWRALVAEAERLGGLHVFVNVAVRGLKRSFADTSLEDVRALIRDNAVSGWLGMKETIPALRQAGGGCVVNVLSTVGRAPDPEAVAFSALSGGLRVASKSAALECAKVTPRVLVNAVLVGDTSSPSGPVNAAEAAAAVVHFASPDGAYLTGMEIYVDAGWSLAGAR